MLDDAQASVELHRILGRERHEVSVVQPLKHLTQPARVPTRSFGPEPTSRRKKGPNFVFDERERLRRDPKAIHFVGGHLHGTIIAPHCTQSAAQ